LIKEESPSELLRFTIRHILEQVHNQCEYLIPKQEQQQVQKNQQQQQHKTFICFYCSEAYLSDKKKVEYIDREYRAMLRYLILGDFDKPLL